jgi:ribosomal protein S12 methylthiotransferase accessory factor YcaO
MLRERFEESKERLSNGLLETIERHFNALDLHFDREMFAAQHQGFLEHLVADAHFTGAEVFPIDIPLRLVR